MYEVDDEKEVFLGKKKKREKKPFKVQYRYHARFLGIMGERDWGTCGSYDSEKKGRQAMNSFRKNQIHNWGPFRSEYLVEESLKEGVMEHFSVWNKDEKVKEFRLIKDE